MKKRRASAKPSVTTGDPVRWQAGVHIEGTRLWCDAPGRGLCFVSAFDVVLPRQHDGKLLCTERTASLVPAATAALITPIRRPFAFGSARLELLPGGRLPGSAQLLIELGNERLLYAGRTIAAARVSAEPRQATAATTVILHAPGAALGTLPDEEAELRRLTEVARAAADERVVFVVAPDSLAVELAARLGQAGVTVRAHRRWAPLLSTVLGARVSAWRAAGLVALGEVVLWPEGAVLPHDQAVVLSVGHVAGEAHFAVADSLDLPGVQRLCAESEARTLYLTAGFSAEVAAVLAAQGVTALPLGPPTQMTFSLSG